MTSDTSTQRAETPLGQDLLYAVRYYLSSRRGLFAIALAALLAGIALNWSWLVAAGVLPLLLSILPCVAMCALGLCMNKLAGRSCSSSGSTVPRGAAEPAVDRAAPNSAVETASDPADPLRTRRVPAVATAPAASEQPQSHR